MHENSYELITNTKSYKYLKDEIPDEKLLKVFTAFLRKRVGQQRYPIQICGSPLDICTRCGSVGNPLIADAEIYALQPFYLLNLKKKF